MLPAIDIYRSRFKPSQQLGKPYVMLGVNVFAADTDQEAKRHFTSVQQAFANLRRGVPGQVPPPIDNIDSYVSPLEKAGIDQALLYSFVGTPATVERGLRVFIAATKPDELMLTGHFHDHSARLRSFELAMEVQRRINEPAE